MAADWLVPHALGNLFEEPFVTNSLGRLRLLLGRVLPVIYGSRDGTTVIYEAPNLATVKLALAKFFHWAQKDFYPYANIANILV